jgi:hypothetical protein
MKQVGNADPYRRRVYAILARMLKFTHSASNVNLMHNVSSIQALSIQLAYFAGRNSNLHNSMVELKTLMEG